MRLTLARRPVPAPRQSEPEPAPIALYDLVETDGRLDLKCTTCHQPIGVGVRADRVAQDAPFFLEAHAPFCLRVTR